MANLKSLIRQLAEYALSKKGAEQYPSYIQFDPTEDPHLHVPGALWTEFFEVELPPAPEVAETGEQSDPQAAAAGHECFAYFPVYPRRLAELRARFPVISETRYVERDGHVQMAVPLAAGLPVAFLKSLIDDAYEIAWNKLDPEARRKIEFAGLPYDEPKLIDRLVEIHDLKQHRKAIHKLARPAVLLRTRKSAEAKIPVGATKIGGRPDLAEGAEWPTYRDGKPLAFLAQLDLAEITRVGTPIKGLPRDGLLSVFSAWGWMGEGDGDPQPPDEGWQDQVGWTAILLTPPGAKLERRKTPRGVNSFKAAAVEATLTLSLPRHRAEPALSAQGWTDDEYERVHRMQSDYHSLQMKHWLGTSNAGASHHLLGGYGLFQQEYPSELARTGRAMLLQIGSDGNTHMGWGDDGELTFCADARALAKGRFERVYCIYQCG